MSYRVGILTKKDTRITEIISIVIFLGLTLIFMLSKHLMGQKVLLLVLAWFGQLILG